MRAPRGRLAYVARLVGSLTALVASVSWAATHAGDTSLRASGRMGAASCTPPRLAGTPVDVRLIGMHQGGMMAGRSMQLLVDRASAPAGRISFIAQNIGVDVHELVVLPLSVGHPVGALAIGPNDRVSESGNLGEASSSCGAGAGDGIEPGAAGWVTLDLKPGRYELVCNIHGHYRAGMYAELDVR